VPHPFEIFSLVPIVIYTGLIGYERECAAFDLTGTPPRTEKFLLLTKYLDAIAREHFDGMRWISIPANPDAAGT